MNKWLDLTASEEMDSRSAYPLIHSSVSFVKSKIGEPKSVLSVGCSDGTEMELFNSVEGIDMNNTSLQKCIAKGFKVHKMDMHKMTFDDNSFELVYSRDVYEHSISHIQVISEMARVSSKYVAITLPGEDWQDSKWHFIIPTFRQMFHLGEKVGLMLKSYKEYNILSGSMVINQHSYLFQK